MNSKIRFATSDDCGVILALIRELAEFEKLSHEVTATEDLLRASLFGGDGTAEALIAEVSGHACGFAIFFHNYSTFLGKKGLYLEDLYVQPKWRGQGIGKQLLSRLAELAVERDCGRMEWAVLDWNRHAIEFYESLGAKPMSDWTVYRVERPAVELLANLVF